MPFFCGSVDGDQHPQVLCSLRVKTRPRPLCSRSIFDIGKSLALGGGALVVQERTLHHRLSRRQHLREGVKANEKLNAVRELVQYDQLVELELEGEFVCKHVVHLPLV